MTANPLVVEAEGPSATAGTGLIGDIANLTADNSPWDYSIDGVSTALDTIGAALDPFGALAGAGVGWLLNHVSFLREPLDQLAGDPAAIQAASETWSRIADQLNRPARTTQLRCGPPRNGVAQPPTTTARPPTTTSTRS